MSYGYEVGDWIEVVAELDVFTQAVGMVGPITRFVDHQALAGEGAVQVWVDWTSGSSLMLLFPEDLAAIRRTDPDLASS